jgi:hypothetical protein
VRISKRDLYNLDTTLARIIHPYLEAFKSLDRYGTISGEGEGDEEILDELIWTFYTVGYGNTHLEELWELIVDQSGGVVVLKDGHVDFAAIHKHPLYPLYKKLDAESEERITAGLNLFSKHFRGLWD